jgi:flavin-dependent dehydrogenase
MDRYDVAIAGAGVAGLALATELARAGHRVVAVEPAPPGAFRVGESLDWEAPILLARLGHRVERWVEQGKATVKGGIVTTSASHPGERLEIGHSPTFRALMRLVGRHRPTVHVDREAVDLDLLEGALAAGAEVISAKVRSVMVEGDRVVGLELTGGRTLRARFYADASGRAALFRRAFGIGHEPIGGRRAVIRARFPHAYDQMGTRLRTDDSLGEPAWVWDINVRESITDIGVVLAASDLARLRLELGSVRAVFLHQTCKHADLEWLEPLVDERTRFWSCTFQNLVAERSGGENWIAVGEAAFVVDALLSSGFSASLRTGLLASTIIDEALARRRGALCPKRLRIYHEKTAAQVRTVNLLLETLWYRGRLRDEYSLRLNVLSILAVNFNLNHLHTRYVPRTLVGLAALRLLHRTIDRLVPAYAALLHRCAS